MSSIVFDPNQINPHIGHWLSHEEFKCVWTYQWVAYSYERLGYESMSEDERQIFLTITSAFDWAIKKLIHNGMRFKGITLRPNGILELDRGGPVEVRNELFLNRLRRGKLLHPEKNLIFTISHLTKLGVKFDRKSFEDALSQCKSDREYVAAQVTPEERVMFLEAIDNLMAEAGLKKQNELS